MKIDDSDLKRLFRSYIRSNPPLPKEACPDPETIAALFSHLGKEEEKEKTIDHISNCARCLEVFDLCLDMTRGQNWLSEEIEDCLKQTKKSRSILVDFRKRLTARPIWNSLLIPLGISFFLIIGVLMIKLVSTHQSDEDRGRTPGAIHLISPGPAITSKSPIVFKWEITKESKFALLDIFDDALLPIWKSPQISGDRYELPPEGRERIKKGKTYFWMLTVVCQDGSTVESVLEEFTLEK